MKREIISNALNYLDIAYISEAQFFSPAAIQASPERKNFMSIKRIVTIALAAALILALGTVAYATGFFGLKDMRVETEINVEEATVNTSGYIDSANYLANVEWQNYIRELLKTDKNTIPAGYKGDMYGAYNAFCTEAKDELHALLEKYELKMPSSYEDFKGVAGLYNLLGTVGFLPDYGDPGMSPVSGKYYQGGSFQLTDTVKLENGEKLSVDIFRYVNGFFIPGAMLVADPDEMEEWTYVCSDGTELVIDMGPTKSTMVAELDNSFVFIYIRSGTENNDSEQHSYGATTVDKETLESLAESIDFAVLDKISK